MVDGWHLIWEWGCKVGGAVLGWFEWLAKMQLCDEKCEILLFITPPGIFLNVFSTIRPLLNENHDNNIG